MLLFDVLNPFCITFGSLTRWLPLLVSRLVRSARTGGLQIIEYIGRSETPAAMAAISGRRIGRMLRIAGCTAEQSWVPYSEFKLHPWLPNVVSAHRLLVVDNARNRESLD